MKSTREKLQKLLLEKQETERIRKYLEALNERISQLEVEIEERKDRYVEEMGDVEKLERESLRNVFAKFLGQDEQALEHERQEVLWAFISFEKASHALEMLKYEKSVLVGKLLRMEYHEDSFKALLEQRENELKQMPQFRISLSLIDHKTEKLQAQDKELQEALQLSDQLKKLFEELHQELGMISHWNQAQRSFYGKGHYSSFKKKKFIERNLELIPRIEWVSEQLRIELDDLKQQYELDLGHNLTLLNNFFVIFFDNLITDWVVRNGIMTSLKTVEMCLARVDRLLLMLRHEMEQGQKSVASLMKEREKLILSGDAPGQEG